MKRRVIVMAVLVTIALAGAVSGGISVSVTPPLLEISVPPGGKKAYTLTIKNVGDTRVSVKPLIMDLTLSVEGAAEPVQRGTSKWSCADWASMNTSEFALNPGEGEERELTFEVPRGTNGGRYCVVVFEAKLFEAKAAGPHVSVATRTGTIIMETVSRTVPRSGEVSELTVKHATGDTMVITAYFENPNDIHVKISPSCVIKGADGKIVDRVKLDAGTGTVLPDGKRQMTGRWANKRKMVPGKYVAEVVVDFRGLKRATKTAEFSLN
ncbi:MAG TPA: hypothetical protein VMU02_05235 [bacterium]|nr:hypothetical protein [bacterium]